MSRLDVIILGGGPAGMSAALVAGRALLKTVVINAESPRNAVTTASHGFLTRDGIHPKELLRLSKAELQTYETVRYVVGLATDVARVEGGYQVTLADGSTLRSQRLVIATGYRNDLGALNLPGIEPVYGRSVYPCVFCDGFEHRGERLAVFAPSGNDAYVLMVRMWSDDVVLFTHGAPVAEERRQALAQRGIRVVEDRISTLISEEGALRAVELESGVRVERDSGFIGDDHATPSTRFAQELGVEKGVNDWGMEVLDVPQTGASKVPCLYVIGDARSGFAGLIAAAAEGAACMAGIVHELAAERWNPGSGRQG